MATPVTYRRAIIIDPRAGDNHQTSVAMADGPADKFIDLVLDCMKKLTKLATGRKLLSQLDLSDKTVTIFAASPTKDSVTTLHPDGISSEIAASMRPFTTRQDILPAAMSGSPNVKQGYVDELTQVNYATAYGAEFYTELTRALNRAKVGMPSIRALIAAKVGLTTQQLADLEAGTTVITAEMHYKLAIPLYEFMTPGPGVNTAIRFENKKEFKDVNTNMFFRPKINDADVPAYIVMGHELIHAWRMMQGRRLVRQGWEEEAMTTGIMEFANFPVTENKLRAEAGLPLRTSYQQGHYSSGVAGVMMLSQPVRSKKPIMSGLRMKKT